jgi:hypothetical protein
MIKKLLTAFAAVGLFISGGAWAAPRPAQTTPTISGQDTSVSETIPYATIAIQRVGGLKKPSAYSYKTVDGTAKAGTDYVAMSGSMTFGSGRITNTISIPIINNDVYVGNRVFSVQLTPLNNATCANCTVNVTIIEDDPQPTTPTPTDPPPPTTQVCPDGSVIPITDNCTTPVTPPTTKTCPDGSVVPADADCPTGTDPTPTGTQTTTVSPGLTGITPIASEFDYNLSIEPSVIPGENVGDTLSAFRFVCGAGQLRYDDPLRAFNQPGKSHLHQFYGNLDANSNSTYETLRAHGQTTCGDPTKPAANRSAYWAPAVLDGNGHVVQPDMNVVYYKRYPKSSTQCNDTRITQGCLALPFGLRYIFGRDLDHLSTTTAATSHFKWYCDNNTGSFDNMRDALAVCSVGHHLVANLDAPTCWNGTQLDSPNHMSHLAYMQDTHLGFPGCPSTHPYIIPEFALNIYYSIQAGDTTSTWSLSSDVMAPTEKPGSTLHADWFGAWDPTVMMMWTDNCMDKHLNCNSGILGNGKELIGTYQPSYGQVNPNHLVPIPVNPNP